MRFLLSLFCLVFSISSLATSENGESVFQADITGVDQNGKMLKLEQWRGHWQVVAFVYGSCTSVCPIILADLKNLNASLSSQQKAKTEFVLISIDPAHDNPQSMKDFLNEHAKKNAHWHFIQFQPEQLQVAAMLFNIRYRQEGNEIAHSRMISLLNTEGVLVHQTNGSESIRDLVLSIAN